MKANRQATILSLIRNRDIERQVELTQKLAEAGFDVTQATVSRDIHEMRLTKVPDQSGGYKFAQPYQHTDADLKRLHRVFRDGFVSMDTAGNLLVLRTFNGMAMAVATSIDGFGFSEVVGTVAGDDVVFCAVKSESDAVSLMERLRRVVR